MPRRRTLISLVLLIAIVALGWYWNALRDRARLGAAYGARLTCSCRYVERRAMGSCEDDKEPGMWLVGLTDRPDDRAVDAHVPLLAHASARFRPGWGCLLDPTK